MRTKLGRPADVDNAARLSIYMGQDQKDWLREEGKRRGGLSRSHIICELIERERQRVAQLEKAREAGVPTREELRDMIAELHAQLKQANKSQD